MAFSQEQIQQYMQTPQLQLPTLTSMPQSSNPDFQPRMLSNIVPSTAPPPSKSHRAKDALLMPSGGRVRVACLGCRKAKERCIVIDAASSIPLPKVVPDGHSTVCHRCKRLGIPCEVAPRTSSSRSRSTSSSTQASKKRKPPPEELSQPDNGVTSIGSCAPISSEVVKTPVKRLGKVVDPELDWPCCDSYMHCVLNGRIPKPGVIPVELLREWTLLAAHRKDLALIGATLSMAASCGESLESLLGSRGFAAALGSTILSLFRGAVRSAADSEHEVPNSGGGSSAGAPQQQPSAWASAAPTQHQHKHYHHQEALAREPAASPPRSPPSPPNTSSSETAAAMLLLAAAATVPAGAAPPPAAAPAAPPAAAAARVPWLVGKVPAPSSSSASPHTAAGGGGWCDVRPLGCEPLPPELFVRGDFDAYDPGRGYFSTMTVVKRVDNGKETFFPSRGYTSNLLEFDQFKGFVNSSQPMRPPYLHPEDWHLCMVVNRLLWEGIADSTPTVAAPPSSSSHGPSFPQTSSSASGPGSDEVEGTTTTIVRMRTIHDVPRGARVLLRQLGMYIHVKVSAQLVVYSGSSGQTSYTTLQFRIEHSSSPRDALGGSSESAALSTTQDDALPSQQPAVIKEDEEENGQGAHVGAAAVAQNAPPAGSGIGPTLSSTATTAASDMDAERSADSSGSSRTTTTTSSSANGSTRGSGGGGGGGGWGAEDTVSQEEAVSQEVADDDLNLSLFGENPFPGFEPVSMEGLVHDTDTFWGAMDIWMGLTPVQHNLPMETHVTAQTGERS